MADKKYRYRGPQTGVTLCQDGKDTDVLLMDGGQYSLPEDHEYVVNMVEQGHFTEIAPAPAAPVATAPKAAKSQENAA
jgi:hypothetical protein